LGLGARSKLDEDENSRNTREAARKKSYLGFRSMLSPHEAEPHG